MSNFLPARPAGIFAEPAGAAAMAGLKKLVETGAISRQDSAVVMVTGHGLKDIDGVMKAVSRQPLEVENILEDVAEKLSAENLCKVRSPIAE